MPEGLAFYDVVAKPVDPQALLTAIASALAVAEEHPSPARQAS